MEASPEIGSNSRVAVADGTGVAVNVSVEVGAGIVEVVAGGGEVGVGGVPPQPVTNKLTIAKRTNNVFIRTRAFLQIAGS